MTPGELRPGDWVTLHHPDSRDGQAAGDVSPAESVEAAMAEAVRLAQMPGAWWKRYPADQAEPTPRQAIVWTMMRTGATGYQVHWHRR